MDVVIRDELASDIDAIHGVNAAAFETDAEARLVDALRSAGALTLSLVADSADGIVGHIAFSPVVLTRPDGSRVSGLGLAPMAVLPSHQRRGIGSRLISAGLERARKEALLFCVVLGHPALYRQSGFEQASTRGIRWEVPVPDEVFMVQALHEHALDGLSGVVAYHAAFSSL